MTRGTEVTVDGRYFVDGCNDVIVTNAFGCEEQPDPLPPLRDVDLRLVAADQTEHPWADAKDARDGGRISWTFTVPADTPVGVGQLQAGNYSEAFWVLVTD